MANRRSMKWTLHFIERLLAIASNLQNLHQDRQALRYLHCLAALPDLPAGIAEEVQARLAEIYLRHRQFRRARRHLGIVLLYQPDSAHYHFLMATALRKGRHRDFDRSAAHYEKSLQLDPEQPRCLADFGLLCLRLDRVEEGLAALTRAVDLAPNDPAIVGKLVKGLCRADRTNEALDVVRAARFRNPRGGRFRLLYNNFMFRRLHDQQESERVADDPPEDAGWNILPFVVQDPATGRDHRVREDQAETLPVPHRRRPLRRSDWKHG
jgi:tetratricopeptide (TPR) repeat protein